jgi:hypothetical protein
MTGLKLTREQYREYYIPKDASEIKDEQTGAVVYLYTNGYGKLRATGFTGKRSKPDLDYTFRTQESRAQTVTEWFARIKAYRQEKADRMQARREWQHGYRVGDILSASWGYEQTNVDFYQVVSVNGKTITVREIACASVPNSNPEGASGMSDRVVADRDHFTGEPMVKRPQSYDGSSTDAGYVTISESQSAHKWDGKPEYRSWYG